MNIYEASSFYANFRDLMLEASVFEDLENTRVEEVEVFELESLN